MYKIFHKNLLDTYTKLNFTRKSTSYGELCLSKTTFMVMIIGISIALEPVEMKSIINLPKTPHMNYIIPHHPHPRHLPPTLHPKYNNNLLFASSLFTNILHKRRYDKFLDSAFGICKRLNCEVCQHKYFEICYRTYYVAQ